LVTGDREGIDSAQEVGLGVSRVLFQYEAKTIKGLGRILAGSLRGCGTPNPRIPRIRRQAERIRKGRESFFGH
jgi:hypothetical protein